MFLIAKFFVKFLARTPRVYVYKLLKLSDFFKKSRIFVKSGKMLRKNVATYSKMFINHKMIIRYHISQIHTLYAAVYGF